MAGPWRHCSGLVGGLRSLIARRSLQNWAPPQDVLLFQHQQDRLSLLKLFCAGQGIFWASMAGAALSGPPVPAPHAETAGRGHRDLRLVLWRYGLAVGCGAMGKAWAPASCGAVSTKLSWTKGFPLRNLGPWSWSALLSPICAFRPAPSWRAAGEVHHSRSLWLGGPLHCSLEPCFLHGPQK